MEFSDADGHLELPINVEQALAVVTLPPLHKDPFDRMLAAPATVEGFVLPSDEQVAAYPGPVRKV